MAINDSNNERRNLTVLSLSIIAFYIGGGELGANGILSLPVININFHDGHKLGYLVWIVLAWFTFRYWIENKESARDERLKELNNKNYFLTTVYAQTAIKNVMNLMKNDDGTRIFYSYVAAAEEGMRSGLALKNVSVAVARVAKSQDEAAILHGAKPALYYKISRADSFHLKTMVFCSMIVLFFRRPSLSAYLIPYLLVLVAIICGLYNFLPCVLRFFC